MSVKSIVKKFVPKKLLFVNSYTKESFKFNKENYSNFKLAKGILKNYFTIKTYFGEHADSKVLNYCKINLIENDFFALSIDKHIFSCNMTKIGNITIDYEQVLNSSFRELKDLFVGNNDKYSIREYKFLDGIENYIKRLSQEVKDETIKENLDKILNSKDLNFVQALQKIIIVNTISWQIGVKLNGLGRLDKILDNYDFPENINDIIYSFLDILNYNYEFKSGVLLGDTGQIIILGGLTENGDYFSNKLTYVFIEQLKKINRPDPKILLRVSQKMDRNLLKCAIDCIKTGIGSPLLSNDDVIVNILKNNGCGTDSYNYVTSACWEPYICGKSMNQNNINGINFMEPFNRIIGIDNLSIDNFLEIYENELKKYIYEKVCEVNKIKFAYNPLLSLYTYDCNARKLDVSEGGAIYNNFGFTTVGLANFVNSYFNVIELCKEKQIYSFNDLNSNRADNFSNKIILDLLKDNAKQYGSDNIEVINFVNHIIELTGNELKKYTNNYGGIFKFGLSSPDYIELSRNISASFDGRKNGEPLNVHISSSNSFDETISFACKLNYSGNAYNGNVIDFLITPDYIEKNETKFIDYIYKIIEDGFFQLQMNVVNYETLVLAKNNPDMFPNLIVRVWGFSAYFKDLPDEYKELLIERARMSESR